MKIVIIFHSVCGNSFLLAKTFDKELKNRGQDVIVYRVRDDDWEEQSDVTEKAKQNLKEMMVLPMAEPEHMLKSDVIIMGCPTYFGNVTAEMKTFMDETAKYWFDAKYAGKKFVAFTSAGNPEGGGDLCLQALHTYAKYMGLLSIPLSPNIVPGLTVNAYGLIQYSFAKYAENLDDTVNSVIEKYVEKILEYSHKL